MGPYGETITLCTAGKGGHQGGIVDLPDGSYCVFPEGDERGDHIFYAVFTMPDCDVDVKFIVNEDGTNPEEDDLENNVASATIELVETFNNLEIINLPYDALSRDISFKLAGENEIKAQLRLPRGSWDGNAKGELKVTNENNDLLHKFEVKDNPKVNEDSETIIRKPIINAQIQRSDFGDNPSKKIYLDVADPQNQFKRKQVLLIMVMLREIIRTGNTVTEKKLYWTPGE